jgi:ribosomal protein S15P/S13E
MLLGQRNRLSKYLLKKNPAQHAKVYAALGLRTK